MGLGLAITLIALFVGLVAGFFISRAIFKYGLKKNPPINREQIKAMYQQMGRKPSEAQINAVMRAMEQQAKKWLKKAGFISSFLF
mgnify:FL=1